jgi:hypothetical protein
MSMNEFDNDSTVKPEQRLSDGKESDAILLKLEQAKKADNKESGEEGFGVELVTMISEISSVVDKNKKTVLFQNNALVDRMENDLTSDLGKSFRSKDLSEADLAEREFMPELEDQWIQNEHRAQNLIGLKRVITVGILLLMSAGIWALINLDNEDASSAIITELDLIKATPEIVVSKEERAKQYEQDQVSIASSVKGFLEASDVEERAKFCRNPEATLSKMQGYYIKDRLFTIYQFHEIVESFNVRVLGKDVSIVKALVNNLDEDAEEKFQTENLLLERQEDGSHHVDWETAVGYQPNDWAKFRLSRSTEPQVFRVEVEERIDHGPYLYDYGDDRKYEAYKIKIRGDSENFLLAYAKIGSEVNEKINGIVLKDRLKNSRPKFIAPMILKVVFPKNAESDQCVEIIEVVSDTWFLP